ncbi:Uncharacterised protein [uncultured archaeon]|nr:Uncharacterised protein [uncultured archaeon]
MKILVLSNLFERDIKSLISEIKMYPELSRLLKLNSSIEAQDIYRYLSNTKYDVISTFFNRLFQLKKEKQV